MSEQRLKFDFLADMLGFQMRRAAAALKPGLDAELEPLGLRTSEATLLIAVGENPGRTQGELGRGLRVKPANMAPLVARLVSAGLLARAPGTGRSVALDLTDAGRERLGQVRAALQRHEAGIVSALSPEEREVVLRALTQIAQRACCGDSD